MTLEQLYLEASRVAKMIEGTDLTMSDVIRNNGRRIWLPHYFNASASYDFALAIVEGTPVFKGDILYYPDGGRFTVMQSSDMHSHLSWNPPKKPKTVMLEVSVAVAQDITEWSKGCGQTHSELGNAAIKALEELK